MLDFSTFAKGDKGLNAKFEGMVEVRQQHDSIDTNLSLTDGKYNRDATVILWVSRSTATCFPMSLGSALEVGVQGGLFIRLQFFFIPVTLEEALTVWIRSGRFSWYTKWIS
jgi:hypothetical protein